MKSTPKRVPARMFLYRVRELMSDPITRQNAFQQTAVEFKVSVNAFRVAAVREGQTEDDQYLKFALPAAYEKALVSV